MSSVARKQAPRLARPAARYWRGKAPKGVVDVDSDSASEEEGIAEDEVREEDEDLPLGAIEGDGDEDDDEDLSRKTAAKDKQGKTMNISLRDVNIKEGKVIVAGREESGRTLMEGSFIKLAKSTLRPQECNNRIRGGVGRRRRRWR